MELKDEVLFPKTVPTPLDFIFNARAGYLT